MYGVAGYGVSSYGTTGVVSAPSLTFQYLPPAQDINSGSWFPSAGSTLYGVLDESAPDDLDYIQTDYASGCEVKLSPGGDPLTGSNHIINYRLLAGTGNLSVTLKCGATVIASWNHTLTGVAQDISNTLSNMEADSISDYSDLRVAFLSSP